MSQLSDKDIEIILCFLKSYLCRIDFIFKLRSLQLLEDPKEEEKLVNKKDKWIEAGKLIQRQLNTLVENNKEIDIAN